MFPMQTILHATDFSDSSKCAFRLACSLAGRFGARLIVLHVAVRPTVAFGHGVMPPDPEECEEYLQECLHCMRAGDPTLKLERRLVEGEPAAEILRVAEETKCDLIVIGTHGRTGLGRLLMGSVAEEVLRKADCPVLTLKTPSAPAASSEECIASPAGKETEFAQ
jgi:nucleotide-binding universal stress UspA family protein